MRTLKKCDVRSHKANSKLLQKTASDGLHFVTCDGIKKLYDELSLYVRTNKMLVYEPQFDSTYSAENIAMITALLTERFPNLVLSLKDSELSLYVKEILKGENKAILVGTNINESTDGDYLIQPKSDNSLPNKNRIIELLKEKRKVILSLETNMSIEELAIASEIMDETNYSDDLTISSWSPELILSKMRSV